MLKLTEHEQSLTDLASFLNVEGVDQGKVSLLIQSLRDNYKEVDTTISTHTQTIDSNKELMEGLRSANMQLLSKLGTQLDSLMNNKPNQQTQQSGQGKQQQQQEETMSLDDLANELMK